MNCNTTHYRANSSSVPGDPTKAAHDRGDVATVRKAKRYMDNFKGGPEYMPGPNHIRDMNAVHAAATTKMGPDPIRPTEDLTTGVRAEVPRRLAQPVTDPRFRHHPKLSDVVTHADRPRPKGMADHEIVGEYDRLRNRGWTSGDYRKSAAQHKRDMAQAVHNENRRNLLLKEMDKRGLKSVEDQPLPAPDHKASLRNAGIEPTPANLKAFSRHKASSRGYGNDLRGLNEMSRSAQQAHWQGINDQAAHAFAKSRGTDAAVARVKSGQTSAMEEIAGMLGVKMTPQQRQGELAAQNARVAAGKKARRR